jgi:hypothetical protein
MAQSLEPAERPAEVVAGDVGNCRRPVLAYARIYAALTSATNSRSAKAAIALADELQANCNLFRPMVEANKNTAKVGA